MDDVVEPVRAGAGRRRLPPQSRENRSGGSVPRGSRRVRAAGFEMRVTLEAVVGFVSRSQSSALAKVGAPTSSYAIQTGGNLEVTANDRRFLRSLRIAADEKRRETVE